MSTEWRWVIGAWLVVILIILIVIWLGGGIKYAKAHESWINQNRLTDPATGAWCCNHTDCRAEKVTEVVGGYRTEAGDTVPYARVIWRSQDGAWWRCRNMQTNVTRCLIGPPPGS